MAKFKGKGVVFAGLVAGVASVLSKKENRDKAMELFNDAKTKATKVMADQKGNIGSTSTRSNLMATGDVAGDVAQTPAGPKSLTIQENRFIDEGGGQTAISEFNKNQS
ncbi:hypothetical protein CSE16_19725 [Solibacillus sp. R5-41]|uniref:hypothetical protein n=1 Tax=Solibacillus sp. R5-41 TaxID=2048654 RepID=UPI000C127148|nr:hypothetical protein [Solibacillus sp. R5-41]ATP42061.1 hypothetical protein CSE16_19725 [Solibacillus sp. R5-41]